MRLRAKYKLPTKHPGDFKPDGEASDDDDLLF
jgi:hypothetical protein